MRDQEAVLDLLRPLPDDVNLVEIGREIERPRTVRHGEAEADRVEVISDEQSNREFASWLTK